MNELQSSQAGAPAKEGLDAFSAAEEATTARSNRLDQSLMLEEQGPGSLFRIAAILVVVFAVAFIFWATNTKLSEVVVASGEVSPAGSVKRVQHLEGGIIKEIHVRDGSLVKKGDLIMTLAPSGAAPQRDQLLARLAGLELESDQLQSIVLGKADLQGRDREKFKSLASTQLAVFDAKQKSIQA